MQPAGPPKLAASFVIDTPPVFAYTGWALAHSLVDQGGLSPSDVHVQFTAEVSPEIVDLFRALGCVTHRLDRFGDGRYCNKIAQWDNLQGADAELIVLLDTDMICVADFSHFLDSGAVGGKIVDLPNPRLETLDKLFELAGFTDRPPTVTAEARDATTYRGNCNGGFYCVPKRFGAPLFDAWRRYALLLLDNIDPLRSDGKESHVDQVSFCMAIHDTGLPFDHLPSNVNYFLHFRGEHTLLDPTRPLSLLHYHNSSLNVVGLLEPAACTEPREIEAIETANLQFRRSFNTRLLRNMHDERLP